MGSKLAAVDYEDALPEYSPSLTIVALSCAHAYTIHDDSLHYTLDVLGPLLWNNYVYMVIQPSEGELSVYPLITDELIYTLQVKRRKRLLI